MACFQPNLRLMIVFLATLIMSGSLTACSKDKKKGTPVAERNTGGGGGSGEAGSETGGESGDTRGTDSQSGEGPKEKATQAPATDVDLRGTDSNTSGVQISSNGLPAKAEKDLRIEASENSEITSTPIDELTTRSDQDPIDTSGGFGGGFGGSSERGTDSGYISDRLNLEALSPDYNNVHIRANHRDYAPITTLGTDPREEFDFTDYDDDLLLNTALRLSMKSNDGQGYGDIYAGDNDFLPQEFFDQSREFAADIKDIRSQVEPYVSGGYSKYSIVSVRMTFDYNGGNKVVDFHGYINGSTKQAVLAQITANGEPDPEHHFQAYLTCMDEPGQGNDCSNSILVVEQVKGGKICKRIFAVLRHTNVALTIDRNDYRSYNSEPNPQKRKLLQYISNTIVARRYMDGYYVPEDGDDQLLFGSGKKDSDGGLLAVLPVPFMERITTRTFAVAHGYGETELLMRESDYKDLNPGVMTNSRLKDRRKDVLRVVGPLAKPIPGKNVSAIVEVDGFIQDEVEAWVAPWDDERLMADVVGSAEIVGNDGRGTIEVKYNFGNSSLMVVYKADNVVTKDPRNIKLYPYQGRQAPENISYDQMPLQF